jgi:exopolysaccharide biosynthesis polyprenyl glycosylphosphotransferase
MLRRNVKLRTQIHQWMDAGLFAIALWLAHWFRYNHQLRNILGYPIRPFEEDYFWLFVAVIPIALIVLETQGFYKRLVFNNRIDSMWRLARSCTIAAVGLILVNYMFRMNAARGVIILFGFVAFGLVYVKEELVRWAQRKRLSLSQFRRRVILVGNPEDTQQIRKEMIQLPEDIEIVGEYDLNQVSIDQFVSVLHEYSINGVILSARNTYFGRVEKAIQACEVEGVEAWLMADFFKTRVSRTSLDEFCGRPVLIFRSAPPLSWSALLKQIFDIVGASFILILTSVITVPVAILIKLTSPGPIFFRQQRAGLNGKPFTMYKFRSMVTNAEQLKRELADLNEMSGPVFKITNDPRVTPIGRFLRKYSIDEFPQLLNVLRGEMSLVGPRPLPVEEVKRFDDVSHRRRLSVRPGLTCLWQVSGRSDLTDFNEWVRLDLQYIDNWSLWLDLKILWRTIPVVFLGKGAR